MKHTRPLACLTVASAIAGCQLPSDPQSVEDLDLAPRTPVTAPAAPTAIAAPGVEHKLVVKFRDEVEARARGGAASLTDGETGTLALAARRDLHFSPLIPLPEATLTSLRFDAARASGVAQPDLASMMVVDVPGADSKRLAEIAAELRALPEVEFAWLSPQRVPPPVGDIAPTTGDFVPQQTYRGLQIGIGIDSAWAAGARGAGIKLLDCEYGWNATHEDLDGFDLHLEPGQTIPPEVAANGWDEHGTAVVGITSGLVNGYGVSGLVPDAEVHTFPEWTVEAGGRRAAAIASAVAEARPGDVVLLEMQTFGPGGEYVPAEYDADVWTVVKTATDKGVIVVGAAGNGTGDLDSPPFAEYRQRGDSGAIIVGAGSADSSHAALDFSTYGSRVDVQGWGESVVSTGYGNFAELGGDKNQRYSYFAGTSSASPIVASAAIALQSVAVARTGQLLTPVQMRQLLASTGTPQGGDTSRKIGPLPNLPAALAALGGLPNQPPTVALTSPEPGATVSGTVTATATAADADGSIARVTFTFPGGVTVDDATAPYSATWNSNAVVNGAYAIGVRATDNAGATTDASAAITVANSTSCAGGTYAATGLPLSIPDNNATGVTSRVDVSGSGTVASLRLSLNVRHPYKGDLKVTLVGPDGTQYVAHNRTGGSGDNVVLTNVPVSSFSGKAAAGSWQLKVQDLAAADLGALQSWSLAVTASCGG